MEKNMATPNIAAVSDYLLDLQDRICQALEQLDQVLLDHPGHVESLLVRGDLLRRLQRLDDAAGGFAYPPGFTSDDQQQ